MVKFDVKQHKIFVKGCFLEKAQTCLGAILKPMGSSWYSKRGPESIFTFKVRTFWQSEVKISVLALWLGALSSLFHNMGVGGYGRYPLFVRARHVQRCVKKCPHFECVIHRFVLALNAGTDTLYAHVYSVSSLWMPGQVGVFMHVYTSISECLPIKALAPILNLLQRLNFDYLSVKKQPDK